MSHLSRLLKNIQKMAKADSFNQPFAFVVDGNSDDPIENIKQMKINHPIQLLNVIKSATDSPPGLKVAGTIITSQPDVIHELQNSFLDNNQLANNNHLIINNGCSLTLNSKNVPMDLLLNNQSHVTLDDHAQLNNCRINNNSHLHFINCSTVEDTEFNHTNTGAIGIDANNQSVFENGPVNANIRGYKHTDFLNRNLDNKISNTELGDYNTFEAVNLNKVSILNTKLHLTDLGTPLDLDTNNTHPNHTLVLNSNLDNTTAFVKNTNQYPAQMTIDKSLLKDSAIYLATKNLDITRSEIEGSLLLDTKNQAQQHQFDIIYNSRLKGIITNNTIVTENSKLIAGSDFPILIDKPLDATDNFLTADNGGILQSNNKSIIRLTKDQFIKPKTIVSDKKYQTLTYLNNENKIKHENPLTGDLSFSDKYNGTKLIDITKIIADTAKHANKQHSPDHEPDL